MSEIKQNPLNESEAIELETLLKAGDPYTILGSSIYENKKDIEKKYLNLISDESKTNQEIKIIENAYKVLITDKYRNVYDEYLVRNDINKKQMSETLENIKSGFLSTICRLIAIPFQNVSILANSPFSISIRDTNQMVKTLYSLKGIRGFYRGMKFNTSSLSIEFTRAIILEFINKLIGSNSKVSENNDIVLSFVDQFTHLITAYPVKMILDCLILSPLSMNVFDVIKTFINRLDSNSGSMIRGDIIKSHSVFDSFSFKNLYYGAIYVIPLMIASQQIRRFVNYSTEKLKNYVQENNDTISPFIKYPSYLLTNVVSTSLIKSALIAPLYVLSTCYPSQLVSSYIQGVEVPEAINPISLAIQLYRHMGLLYFYKGFIPMTGFRLFESFSRLCFPNTTNNEVVFE
ncbi:hypothetical protein RB653_010434 [Dictyostelium firmibasis]|uniref:J domain-containing protein n=1 Tax=Dictyostelium firmibasis TaxID=79012 RepID=A0AAN7U1H0_9MYCE